MQTAHLDIRTLPGAMQRPRIGLIVPRHKHTAVERNRLRRRLRELIRLEVLPKATSGDTLIHVKPDAYDVSFVSLRNELDSIGTWFARMKI